MMKIFYTTVNVQGIDYHCRFEPDLEDGGYVISVKDLPGALTQAETWDEGIEMVKDCITVYLAACKEVERIEAEHRARAKKTADVNDEASESSLPSIPAMSG